MKRIIVFLISIIILGLTETTIIMGQDDKRYKQIRISVIASTSLVIDDYVHNEIEISYDIKNNGILFDLFSRNIEFGKANIVFYYDFKDFLNYKEDGDRAKAIEKEYYDKWTENNFVMNKSRMEFDGKMMIMPFPKLYLTTSAIDELKRLQQLKSGEHSFLGMSIAYDHYDYGGYKPKTINLYQEYLFHQQTPFMKTIRSDWLFPFDKKLFEIYFGNEQDIKYEIKIKNVSYLEYELNPRVLENRHPYRFIRKMRSIFEGYEYCKICDRILTTEIINFKLFIKRHIYCRIFAICALSFLIIVMIAGKIYEFWSFLIVQYLINMFIFRKPFITVLDIFIWIMAIIFSVYILKKHIKSKHKTVLSRAEKGLRKNV